MRKAAADADAVPERPVWLNGPPAREAARTVRPLSPPAQSSPVLPPPRPVEDAPPLPWQTRAVNWLMSSAAAGYGLSLFLHLLMLVAMAFYVLPGLTQTSDITTVVQSDTRAPEEFSDVEELKVEMPAGNEQLVQPQLTQMIQQDADLTLLEHDFLMEVTAAQTRGEGGATGEAGGGFRLLEPANAVRKGSFTAWTIPIARRIGEKPQAGDSPRPGQPYFIVIQVQLQEGRRTYKISDLSGRITGTDGYAQLIPAQAFVQEQSGQLTRASMSRLLPILDGVSQILIKVPGADALVKDTISIKSRSLKEQQTLELVFGKSP